MVPGLVKVGPERMQIQILVFVRMPIHAHARVRAHIHICISICIRFYHTFMSYGFSLHSFDVLALPIASLSLIGHERDTFLLVQCFSFPPVRQVLLLFLIGLVELCKNNNNNNKKHFEERGSLLQAHGEPERVYGYIPCTGF